MVNPSKRNTDRLCAHIIQEVDGVGDTGTAAEIRRTGDGVELLHDIAQVLVLLHDMLHLRQGKPGLIGRQFANDLQRFSLCLPHAHAMIPPERLQLIYLLLGLRLLYAVGIKIQRRRGLAAGIKLFLLGNALLDILIRMVEINAQLSASYPTTRGYEVPQQTPLPIR